MSAAVADPTLASLKLLDDPSRWIVVKRVPVFCAHRRKVKNKETGEEKEIVVTDDDLHEIAANARALERDSGGVPGLWLGHRKPDPNAPETEQPPLVGFSRNWTVGKWGPRHKLGVLVDLCYDRRHWHEAKKYPYRSAEFYGNTNEVTGVALLKRDPQLDMGMILNARDGEPIFYAADPTEPPPKPDPKEELEEELEEEEGKKKGDGEEKFSPEDEEHYRRFAKCMQRFMSAMGPSNAGLPAPVKKDAGLDRNSEPDRMQRTQESVQYRRDQEEKAALSRRVKALEQARQEDALRYARNETQLVVEGLAREGFQLGTAEEMRKLAERMAKMSTNERIDYEREIRDKWNRAPVGGDWLDTRAEADTYARLTGERDGTPDGVHQAPRGHDAVLAYMRANPGMTYEQAQAEQGKKK